MTATAEPELDDELEPVEEDTPEAPADDGPERCGNAHLVLGAFVSGYKVPTVESAVHRDDGLRVHVETDGWGVNEVMLELWSVLTDPVASLSFWDGTVHVHLDGVYQDHAIKLHSCAQGLNGEVMRRSFPRLGLMPERVEIDALRFVLHAMEEERTSGDS